MPEQGEIWLANLDPRYGTEPGKTRPVLIVQTHDCGKDRSPGSPPASWSGWVRLLQRFST